VFGKLVCNSGDPLGLWPASARYGSCRSVRAVPRPPWSKLLRLTVTRAWSSR